jgi:LemA protein
LNAPDHSAYFRAKGKGIVFSLLILLGLVIVLAFWAVGIYNALVTARNAFRNAFAQIDVQLQRRFDLIPNLVETAKGYLTHERETLEAVIAARGAAISGLSAAKASPGDPAAMGQLAATQGALDGALGRLLAVAEAYPDLKANQNMMQLTEELTSTENKVAFARQAFNDSVMGYNNRREVFPGNVVAGMFGFAPAALLEIPAEQQAQVRAAPKVQF